MTSTTENFKPSHIQVAQLIRPELKKRGLKNSSVRTRHNNVDVRTENLSPKAAQELRQYLDQYSLGHFCGYEDMYVNSNKNPNIPQVKFMNFHNAFSQDLQQKAYDILLERTPKHLVGLPTKVEELNHSHADSRGRSVTESINEILLGRCQAFSTVFWSQDQLAH